MSDTMLIENATNIIKLLNADDLKKVVVFATGLLETSSSPFEPITKEQMIKDLETSREQIKAGMYQDFEKAIEDISLEIGL